MSIVSRETLRSFFQSGSKPGAAHFALLINSLVHLSEDKDLIGLKNHSASGNYMVGDSVIYQNRLYQCTNQNTGEFNSADWQVISGGEENVTNNASVFGSEYEMLQSTGESFATNASLPAIKLSLNTGLRTGTHRVQWSLVAHHQAEGGLGKFQLMNTTRGQLVGVALIYRQLSTQERIWVGDAGLIQLNGSPEELELQYHPLDNGMRQYTQNAKIEIFKIHD